MGNKIVSIADIAEIVLGGTPNTKIPEYWNGKIKWATAKDISSVSGKYLYDTEKSITELGLEKSPAKVLEKDTIIISARGTVGKFCMLPYPMAFNQTCYGLVAKKGIVDPHYLYYRLFCLRNQINSLSYGTTFNTITKKTFRDIKFELPPLPEQQKIASILSAFDDKIELNNEMNKTLEEIAQAIFKHWFIDFEFPNENGEPYKSSGGEFVDSELGPIPKGWEVVELRNFVKIIPGYSYRKSDLSSSRYALVTIKNFERGGGFKIDGFKEISNLSKVKEHHYLKKYDLIVAHTDLTQKGEIIGNPVLILTENDYDKLVMSMDVVKVESKHERINNFILYLYLKQERFKKHALGYATGTTVLHLNKNAILDYKIPLSPKYEIYETLSNLLKNIFNKISNNLNENKTLSQLRDTLLPKLISGEIRVM